MSPQIYRNGKGGFFNSPTVWRVITTVNVLIACAALFLSVYFPSRNASTTDTIHRNLVTSCITAGDPVRHTVVGLLRDQIAVNQSVDPKFFPNIPPKAFNRLIHGQIKDARKRIAALQNVPSCTDRFQR